jgi:hypothetical protein
MSPPKPLPRAATEPVVEYDVFISLRFSEAMEEAAAIKAALVKRGLNVFLCDVPPGKDIAQTVIAALAQCKMVVIMGSETYGAKTTAGFSTYEE